MLHFFFFFASHQKNKINYSYYWQRYRTKKEIVPAGILELLHIFLKKKAKIDILLYRPPITAASQRGIRRICFSDTRSANPKLIISYHKVDFSAFFLQPHPKKNLFPFYCCSQYLTTAVK
jgi:hypothetical protein